LVPAPGQVRREFDLRHTLFLQLLYPVIVVIRDCRGERHRSGHVYLECGATSTGGQGQGVIYYGADGTAIYKSAGRGMLHGTWAVKGNTACTDWKEVPNNPCRLRCAELNKKKAPGLLPGLLGPIRESSAHTRRPDTIPRHESRKARIA
jgi:hypothetical protein